MDVIGAAKKISEAGANLDKFCRQVADQVTHVLISYESLFYRTLPSARQHPSYSDGLEVKREYYQNCSMLGCVTQCSQSAAHSCEQFLQVQQIGSVTLGPLRCV